QYVVCREQIFLGRENAPKAARSRAQDIHGQAQAVGTSPMVSLASSFLLRSDRVAVSGDTAIHKTLTRIGLPPFDRAQIVSRNDGEKGPLLHGSRTGLSHCGQ